MQTVLIADDEENIREGIKLIIDWDELGFEIAGDASNGEEALSAIMKINPSLVVMDMQMPKIHGIDVIKKARAAGYEGYFIILSGYSDFSYARDAIKNKVTNYITKPVDEDELYETVKRIGEEIEKNAKEGQRSGKLRKKAKSVVTSELLIGTYFDVDKDSVDRTFSQEQRDELDAMGLLCSRYQVVIHETYHTGREAKRHSEEMQYKLTDMLPAFLDENYYEILESEGYNCILLKGKAAVNRFRDFILHYEKSPIESDSPLDNFFIAIGSLADSPYGIEESYESAKRLADRRFFCDEGEHFIRAEDLAGVFTESMSSDTEERRDALKEEQERITDSITEAVTSGNRTAMINAVEELYDAIKRGIPGNSDACLYSAEVLLQVKDRLTKQYPVLSELFDSHARIIELIEGRFYLYEIMQYMTETLDKVLLRLHEHAATENIIDDIISYTDRNYAQPLTLEELAARFGYNSGYLGRLFTRTTGTGYNYYLNECRIAKAKEFLSEGTHKVYEVAQLVGYNDVDYFGKKFRKHAGMTPAEFRRQMREKE